MPDTREAAIPNAMKPQHEQDTNTERSTLQMRVLYADTDKMNVVYYANYLRWFEAGRAHYMRCRGYTYREIEQSGIQLPVVEAHRARRRAACRRLHVPRVDQR